MWWEACFCDRNALFAHQEDDDDQVPSVPPVNSLGEVHKPPPAPLKAPDCSLRYGPMLKNVAIRKLERILHGILETLALAAINCFIAVWRASTRQHTIKLAYAANEKLASDLKLRQVAALRMLVSTWFPRSMLVRMQSVLHALYIAMMASNHNYQILSYEYDSSIDAKVSQAQEILCAAHRLQSGFRGMWWRSLQTTRTNAAKRVQAGLRANAVRKCTRDRLEFGSRQSVRAKVYLAKA